MEITGHAERLNINCKRQLGAQQVCRSSVLGREEWSGRCEAIVTDPPPYKHIVDFGSFCFPTCFHALWKELLVSIMLIAQHSVVEL